MAKNPKKHGRADDDPNDHEDVEDRADDSAGSAIVPRVRRRVFRPTWLFLLAVFVFGWLAGPSLVERLPDLAERDEYRLEAQNIHLKDRPHWVPHDLVQQVAEQEDWDAKPISLLDDSSGEQIAWAFARHPWVKSVERLKIRAGAEVQLEIAFRRPVAMAEAGSGRYYPIDADAVLLPPADFSRADVKRYPILVNPPTMPEGPAGSYWGDLIVLGAARLAERLGADYNAETTHWEHLKLRGDFVASPDHGRGQD